MINSGLRAVPPSAAFACLVAIVLGGCTGPADAPGDDDTVMRWGLGVTVPDAYRTTYLEGDEAVDAYWNWLLHFVDQHDQCFIQDDQSSYDERLDTLDVIVWDIISTGCVPMSRGVERIDLERAEAAWTAIEEALRNAVAGDAVEIQLLGVLGYHAVGVRDSMQDLMERGEGSSAAERYGLELLTLQAILQEYPWRPGCTEDLDSILDHTWTLHGEAREAAAGAMVGGAMATSYYGIGEPGLVNRIQPRLEAYEDWGFWQGLVFESFGLERSVHYWSDHDRVRALPTAHEAEFLLRSDATLAMQHFSVHALYELLNASGHDLEDEWREQEKAGREVMAALEVEWGMNDHCSA